MGVVNLLLDYYQYALGGDVYTSAPISIHIINGQVSRHNNKTYIVRAKIVNVNISRAILYLLFILGILHAIMVADKS